MGFVSVGQPKATEKAIPKVDTLLMQSNQIIYSYTFSEKVKRATVKARLKSKIRIYVGTKFITLMPGCSFTFEESFKQSTEVDFHATKNNEELEIFYWER